MKTSALLAFVALAIAKISSTEAGNLRFDDPLAPPANFCKGCAEGAIKTYEHGMMDVGYRDYQCVKGKPYLVTKKADGTVIRVVDMPKGACDNDGSMINNGETTTVYSWPGPHRSAKCVNGEIVITGDLDW